MNAVGRPSAFVNDHLAPRQAELASGHHEQTVAHTRSAEPQYTQQWAGRERTLAARTVPSFRQPERLWRT